MKRRQWTVDEARLRRILAYIDQYATEHERPPSIRDIAAAEQVSRTCVENHIELLIARGKLTQGPPGTKRTLAVVK